MMTTNARRKCDHNAPMVRIASTTESEAVSTIRLYHAVAATFIIGSIAAFEVLKLRWTKREAALRTKHKIQ